MAQGGDATGGGFLLSQEDILTSGGVQGWGSLESGELSVTEDTPAGHLSVLRGALEQAFELSILRGPFQPPQLGVEEVQAGVSWGMSLPPQPQAVSRARRAGPEPRQVSAPHWARRREPRRLPWPLLVLHVPAGPGAGRGCALGNGHRAGLFVQEKRTEPDAT